MISNTKKIFNNYLFAIDTDNKKNAINEPFEKLLYNKQQNKIDILFKIKNYLKNCQVINILKFFHVDEKILNPYIKEEEKISTAIELFFNFQVDCLIGINHFFLLKNFF